MKRKLLTAITLATTLLTTAYASDTESRLERIKKTGFITIGHGETGVPFSYVGSNGPTGFSTELALRISEAIKAHLGLSKLDVRWNPMTLATRFPLMTTGTVDIECSTTTHNRAREAMVGFSNTFYVSEEALALPENSTAQSLNDLSGKRISVTRNTTTAKALTDRNLPINVVLEASNPRALAALFEGKADGYIAGQSIIAGAMISSAGNNRIRIIPSGGAKEAFACMLPKGDSEMKKVVDQAISSMMASGEMEKLYSKWFTQPVPPFGKSAGMPLNNANRQLYANPNDSVLD